MTDILLSAFAPASYGYLQRTPKSQRLWSGNFETPSTLINDPFLHVQRETSPDEAHQPLLQPSCPALIEQEFSRHADFPGNVGTPSSLQVAAGEQGLSVDRWSGGPSMIQFLHSCHRDRCDSLRLVSVAIQDLLLHNTETTFCKENRARLPIML